MELAHLSYDLTTGVRSLAVEFSVLDTVTYLTVFEEMAGQQAETCNQVGKNNKHNDYSFSVVTSTQGIKGK